MLAAVFLAVLCGQQVFGAAVDMLPPKTHELMDACMKETGTKPDEIFMWADGGDANDHMKCMMKCMMMKEGKMSESGMLNLEPMLAMTPAEQQAMVTECAKTEQGSGDLCDIAYRNQLCMREKSPDFYSDRIKLMVTNSPVYQ